MNTFFVVVVHGLFVSISTSSNSVSPNSVTASGCLFYFYLRFFACSETLFATDCCKKQSVAKVDELHVFVNNTTKEEKCDNVCLDMVE